MAEAAQRERLGQRGDLEELLPRHVAFADWRHQHARDPGKCCTCSAPTGARGAMVPRHEPARHRWRIGTIDSSRLSREETNQAALQRVTDATGSGAGVQEVSGRQLLSANRARMGPSTARMKTYGVATAPTAALDTPTKPMMTSENSPRATSAVPARH